MTTGKRGAPIGNQNSVKKKRLFTDMLRRVVAQGAKADGGENNSRLRNMCLKIVEKAEDGDIQAFKEVADRVDGKAVQAIEGTGDNGVIRIIHESK